MTQNYVFSFYFKTLYQLQRLANFKYETVSLLRMESLEENGRRLFNRILKYCPILKYYPELVGERIRNSSHSNKATTEPRMLGLTGRRPRKGGI
jgi:hypothetical protein